MQSEQAVHPVLKSAILIPPGGHTGQVLFSFTVESFLGLGAVLSCPFAVYVNPNRSRTDSAMTLRLLSSVTWTCFLNFTIPYEMALSWQAFMQLKHSTHLVTSISCLRKSIHEDLHLNEHLPHLVQAVSSNFILRIEILERRPSKVPTGHIVLQYNRPLVNDRVPTRIKKAAGME